MSCEWTEERLPLLRYGDLEADERDRALAHLEGCAACREARAAVDASAAALESVPLRHPDAGRVGDLKARVLAAVGAAACPREADLLDPEADPADLAAHAAQCAPCREAGAAFGRVRAALDLAPVTPPAPAALAASKAAVLARTGAAAPAGRLVRFPRRALAAAAAALLVAGAFALGRTSAPDAPADGGGGALVYRGELTGDRGWVAPAIQACDRELAALRAVKELPARPSPSDLEEFIAEFPDAPLTTGRAIAALAGLAGRTETRNKYTYEELRGPGRELLRGLLDSRRMLQVLDLREGMGYEDAGQLTQARECYRRAVDADPDTPAGRIARERLQRLG